MNPRTYPHGTRWTFTALRGGNRVIGNLSLSWEVNGDSISDDYDPDEIAAEDLLDLWLDWVWQNKAFHPEIGEPHVSINWFAHGAETGTFEFAPPIVPGDDRDNFLTFYSEPLEADTEEGINWLRLPVLDKLWRPGRADKGGFIQEATGFKPSALQPTLDLRVLGAAGAGWGGLGRGG